MIASTRATDRICAAAVMAEARSLDLLRHRIFRLQPEHGHSLEPHGKFLAAVWARASRQQWLGAAMVNSPAMLHALLPGPSVSFVASVLSPRLQTILISQFSSPCRQFFLHLIFSSLSSVSVSASGAFWLIYPSCALLLGWAIFAALGKGWRRSHAIRIESGWFSLRRFEPGGDL